MRRSNSDRASEGIVGDGNLGAPAPKATPLSDLTLSSWRISCLESKKIFEVVQAIRDYDPTKVTCPDCSSKKVERLWSEVFAITSKKS